MVIPGVRRRRDIFDQPMKDEGHFSWISGQKKYTFLAIKAILSWKSPMAWIKVDDQPGRTVDLLDFSR
ncbi:MAG: hypothetical protein Ct9H90mP1_1850 [Methanobacteriota archaeon]|nr:MAG: hypothetical protein Ct9H90mP1_1850 [Euryarchaeota archaeon]